MATSQKSVTCLTSTQVRALRIQSTNPDAWQRVTVIFFPQEILVKEVGYGIVRIGDLFVYAPDDTPQHKLTMENVVYGSKIASTVQSTSHLLFKREQCIAVPVRLSILLRTQARSQTLMLRCVAPVAASNTKIH
jgi:hypothetical protein